MTEWGAYTVFPVFVTHGATQCNTDLCPFRSASEAEGHWFESSRARQFHWVLTADIAIGAWLTALLGGAMIRKDHAGQPLRGPADTSAPLLWL